MKFDSKFSVKIGNLFFKIPFSPFLCVQVTELEFQALNRDQSPMAVDPETAQGETSSVWNCDGEIIRESNVRVRNHRQHVQVLTRRKEPPSKPERSLCFRCVDTSPEYVT